MQWFVPTWNGDVRVVPGKDGRSSVLTVEKPTPHELNVLQVVKKRFLDNGWVEESAWPRTFTKWRKRNVAVSATVEDIGPVISELMRPGKAVLTAIVLKNKEITTCSSERATLSEETSKVLTALKKEAEAKPEKAPEAAATVKRPTPCCPECQAGAVGPATEVLLSFLSPSEHESWAKSRSIIIRGGLSGHRYLLAHRNTPAAAQNRRICYDLDSGGVLHFHDRSVPPEEEVLAAKLILEHRENWLRNEATCFALPDRDCVFKNPFGGIGDGTESTALTTTLGTLFAGLDKKRPATKG